MSEILFVVEQAAERGHTQPVASRPRSRPVHVWARTTGTPGLRPGSRCAMKNLPTLGCVGLAVAACVAAGCRSDLPRPGRSTVADNLQAITAERGARMTPRACASVDDSRVSVCEADLSARRSSSSTDAQDGPLGNHAGTRSAVRQVAMSRRGHGGIHRAGHRVSVDSPLPLPISADRRAQGRRKGLRGDRGGLRLAQAQGERVRRIGSHDRQARRLFLHLAARASGRACVGTDPGGRSSFPPHRLSATLDESAKPQPIDNPANWVVRQYLSGEIALLCNANEDTYIGLSIDRFDAPLGPGGHSIAQFPMKFPGTSPFLEKLYDFVRRGGEALGANWGWGAPSKASSEIFETAHPSGPAAGPTAWASGAEGAE